MTGADKHTRTVRPWCAVFQWPGMKPFLFGTATVSADARHDEVEVALFGMLSEIVPENVANPKLIDMLPGALFFSPEPDEA